MYENPPDKDNILSSLLSFKKAFDKKITNISRSHETSFPSNDHFINIYKTGSNEVLESLENNSLIVNSQLLHNKNSSRVKISEADFFNNSELLMSNINDIINKDINFNAQNIVKVPTSDSLIENEEDHKLEPGEQNKSVSPNTTGHNFYKNERLNSIDEKDESKEDDTISKSSKERIAEEYYIVNQKELKESFKSQKEKENCKEIQNLYTKENGKENDNNKEIAPKFAFLDYKEFKNKSEHHSNDPPNKEKPYGIDYSTSMSAIPHNNNSSIYQKKLLFFKNPNKF